MSQRDTLLSNPVSGTEQGDTVGSTSKEVKNLESSAKENEQTNDVSLAETHSEDDASECLKDGILSMYHVQDTK